MKLGYLALALGTFSLGLTEFVMMGVLPDISKDMKTSIPNTGHLISFYAMGVCVGAPLMVIFARKMKLKWILIMLMLIFAIGNLLFATAKSFEAMAFWRFFAGLPHGAYFSVGGIVASKMAEKGKESSAIAAMISGMTIANLIGVPLGTFIAAHFSWRITYLLIAVWGIFTVLSLIRWIPKLDALPDHGFKGQFQFMKKPEPWILLLAIAFGNGALFCYYSYISKLMTTVSGFNSHDLGYIMILAGTGMVAGNIVGGKLSDRFSPALVAMITQAVIIVVLVLIFGFSHYSVLALFLMFISTVCLFAVSAPQQLLLFQNSKGGEMLGGSLAQVGFNLGNAIGAFLGGIPITMGYSYNYTAIPGIVMAILGFSLLFYYFSKHKTKTTVRSNAPL